MTLISASLLFAGNSTWAEKIIGSVDQQGSVTFSDRVPANAVKSKEIRIDTTHPSQDSLEATRENTQQMIDAANQSREDIENVRKAREELAEKRRSSIEADQQRSQETTAPPIGGVYVIDGNIYAPERESEYVPEQEPGYIREREPEYIGEREPVYIREREPEYIGEREPVYIK
jgi:ribosomal protein L14E/L6E/L27E